MSNNNASLLSPADKLNVIDFGHYYAGPMTGMLLAEQGANVIRVVKPGEQELGDAQYQVLNRNKKIVSLDLKTPEGKAQALSLIDMADVVIENFRPGVMKRLGLDYASVKTRNPRLVYLSLPGFASTDKKRAHIQAWEGVLNAAAGFYNQSSRIREMLNFPPLYTSVPLCSVHGALHGVTAVMAALLHRESSGQGTCIEVPLFEAGTSAVSSLLLHVDPAKQNTGPAEVPEPFKPFQFRAQDSHEEQLTKLRAASQVMLPSPFYVLPHTCKDGRHLVVCCGGHPGHTGIFLRVLGLDKQLKQEGFINEGPWKVGLDNNLSGTLSPENTQRVKQLVSETLLTKTALEWETLLADAGFPAAMVRTRDEWFGLQPMWDAGVFATLDTSDATLSMPGKLVSVTGLDENTRPQTYAPPQAVSYEQAAEQLAANHAAVAGKKATGEVQKGEMLKGIKVLDLTSVLAGPTTSYTLAQYGAEIIRLESPNEGPGLLPHKLEIMQGKRSMLLDITTQPGREVFEKLIKTVDVVLHNSMSDVAKRLGVSHSQIQAINSKAITCQISAFAGPQHGPWGQRPGYDCIAQSVCGIMVNFSSLDMPEDHGAVTCADVTTGESAAFAILLALYQRQTTGIAGEAQASLVQGINFAQLPFMISKAGSSDWGEPKGQFAKGPSISSRLYQCEDGWIYVHATEPARLKELVGSAAAADESVVETAFSQHPSEYWLRLLQQHDIACSRAAMPVDITGQSIRNVDNRDANETAEGSLDVFHRPEHPGGLSVTFAGPTWVRIGESHNYKRLHAAPTLGQDTTKVLAELGYSEEEIATMLRLRIAFEYIPAMGSKDAMIYQPELHNDA